MLLNLEHDYIDTGIELADLCIAVESSFTDFVVESIELQITNESADEETKKTGMVEKIKNFFKMVWNHISNFFKKIVVKISHYLELNQKWLDKNKDAISKLGNATFEFKGINGKSPIDLFSNFYLDLKRAKFNVLAISTKDKDKIDSYVENEINYFKDKYLKIDQKPTTFKASDAKDSAFHLGTDAVKYVKSVFDESGKFLKELEQSTAKNATADELRISNYVISAQNKIMNTIIHTHNNLIRIGMKFVKSAVNAQAKANKS